MEAEPPNSAAAQRAFAVAKLKRAASLPRMKDGRRPPMHKDGVSEGEKTPAEGAQGPSLSDAQIEKSLEEAQVAKQAESEAEEKGEDAERGEAVEVEMPVVREPDENLESKQEPPEPASTPDPSGRKRRSRSRSRSRGSRDFKAKTRATQSPTPSPLVQGNDSSPEDSPPPPPPINLPSTPQLVSPIPSHYAGLQASQILKSPWLMSPEQSTYPGTSPPTPSPMTPMLPTLEALQKGLFRSNSAAARMMAMQKLTGVTDTYNPGLPSPAPSPGPSQLGRSNTVAGGERSAARKMMLRRLGERIKEEHGDQTSGGSGAEDAVAPSLPPSPKRKRRRSRRGSVGAATAAAGEGSDYLSTATNTPIVPPTPLPFSIDNLILRADPMPQVPSATPSRAASAQNHIFQRETALAKLNGGMPFSDYEQPRKRRSVVVEDEDDVPEENEGGLPGTPERPILGAARAPHSSATSTETASGVPVPVYMSTNQSSFIQSNFPSSPFGTPLKEERSFRDDDEERVLFQADNYRGRSPFHDAFDREISWVADPVPQTNIPVHDDSEDDENEDETHDDEHEEHDEEHTHGEVVHIEDIPKTDFSPDSYDEPSPRASNHYKDLVIETETSPEQQPSNIPPSPSSVAALSNTGSIIRASDESDSPQAFPARLSVASRIQSDRSPMNTDFELDDVRGVTADTSHKRGDSASTWEKVKSTFSRSGSTGRRSRTNSVSRRDNTDSSVSRDSGASLVSAKTDKNQPSVYPQPALQHSASTSMLSLSPQTAPRGGVSPIPPASSADLLKYQDSKLFPFPGMKKLEEQRNRVKGLSMSLSTPDILLAAHPDEGARQSSGSSETPAQTPDRGRERNLSHHGSDTNLMAKYQVIASPQISANPSTSSHTDYFTISPRAPAPATMSHNQKLPTTREGVRRWLSTKKIFPSPSVTSPTLSASSASPATPDPQPPAASKRPSLSDVLLGRKENGIAQDWEEVESEKSKTPTSASSTTFTNKLTQQNGTSDRLTNSSNIATVPSDTEKTPKARKAIPLFNKMSPRPYLANIAPEVPSPAEHPTSSTPDPLSSLSDYPSRSISGSSSNTSSQYSQYNVQQTPSGIPSQGPVVLQRLDEMLGRGSRSPMWASAIDDPPRKLLLSSPVLQVVNSNTVKDRFLFLFNDILVIAKPIIQEQDALMDLSKPNPMDRKFVAKSVILLRELCFTADREESHKRSSSFLATPRHPIMRTFVLQFAKDPDLAISSLFEKAGRRDDQAALGQLLFRTLELDRAQLGSYLSRRTSKLALKAYVDSFGFTGLRVDKALRVFLCTLNIPERTAHTYTYSPLDALLDSFASRWFEANAGIVAYSKDLAFRLVRAVVQLNDVLHGSIAQEPGSTGHPRRNVTSRDFVEAFRKYDGSGSATDELLDNIYDSIRRERLSQARNVAAGGPPDIAITIKRRPPVRLTYRVQSEPIILRIPQPDVQLTIQLYGQGLMFDPPVLNFAKSSEASFRVTGTSLGSKTMIISRSGANAPLYTGLPQSSPVVVERAFMRNTFNLAFVNHNGVKRKYMFSVDDPLIRHQWAVSINRQIEIASNTTNANSGSAGTSKFHRAAEGIAFKVLQETLVGPPPSFGLRSPSGKDSLDRSSGTNDVNFVFAQEQRHGGPIKSNQNRNSHVRSKSRSQVYPQGAGQMELSLNQNGYSSFDSFNSDDGGQNTPYPDQESRVDGRLWSGRDLEMHCQQNSSIALVLAYLQIGAPDQGYS